jgi:hypothetical protein
MDNKYIPWINYYKSIYSESITDKSIITAIITSNQIFGHETKSAHTQVTENELVIIHKNCKYINKDNYQLCQLHMCSIQGCVNTIHENYNIVQINKEESECKIILKRKTSC